MRMRIVSSGLIVGLMLSGQAATARAEALKHETLRQAVSQDRAPAAADEPQDDEPGLLDRADLTGQADILRDLNAGKQPDFAEIGDAFELSEEALGELRSLAPGKLAGALERMHQEDEARYGDEGAEGDVENGLDDGSPEIEREPLVVPQDPGPPST